MGMLRACMAPAIYTDARLRSLLDGHSVQLLGLHCVTLGAVHVVSSHLLNAAVAHAKSDPLASDLDALDDDAL